MGEYSFNRPIFHGTLKKIQLTSNNMCYGPCPEDGTEIEQRLTLVSDGRVWLSHYELDNAEYKLKRKEFFKISYSSMKRIMDDVTVYFSAENSFEFVTDSGDWALTLVNCDGDKYQASGPICDDLMVQDRSLSDTVRTCLMRSDLFVFDGRAKQNRDKNR